MMPVYSDPAHPEQNGRHKRMHRDLKASCAKPSAFDMKAQQRRLNAFVKEYTNMRPHEALEISVLKVTNGPVRCGSYNWVDASAS